MPQFQRKLMKNYWELALYNLFFWPLISTTTIISGIWFIMSMSEYRNKVFNAPAISCMDGLCAFVCGLRRNLLRVEWVSPVLPHWWRNLNLSHFWALANTDAISAQFKRMSLPLEKFTWARSQGDEHQRQTEWHPWQILPY